MNIKKFFISLISTFLILSIVFAGIGLFSSSNKFKSFLDKGEGSEKNILVAGVDEDGTRSDVIMLVCTDSKNKTIDLISIPRDTRVEMKKGKFSKINSCIGKEDGEELLTQKVKELTGLPIHNFCRVNFEGFIKIIDILGGVEYNVPYDMNYDDPVQDLHIHLKAGMQRLDGKAAHDFVRFRHNNKDEAVYAPGEYAQGDIGRIGAQQDFLKEIVKQKLKLRYVFKLPSLMRVLDNTLDTDLSTMDILSIGLKLKNGSKVDLNSHILPGESKRIGGVSYYVASETADEEIDIILNDSKSSPDDLSDKVIE